MAFFYTLSIECGVDKARAEACAAHFAGWEFILDGKTESCRANLVPDRQEDGPDIWWVVVVPSGVSQSGVHSTEAALTMTGAGMGLLERLKTAPSYRFAWIGVETQAALRFEDLVPALAEESAFSDDYDGLVVSEDVYRNLGSPEGFAAYSQGYLWLPYRGERYSKGTVGGI